MKKIFTIIIVLVFSSSFTPALGQQLSIGEPAKQSVEIHLEENGEVHVIHVVEDIKTVSQVDFISGSFSNLQVSDIDGNEVQYAMVGAETGGITIFPTQKIVLIQYDLNDVLILKDELWTWDYVYLATTTFVFPESVDLVFANDRPVRLDDAQGMRCHGCDALIEYAINPPMLTREVQWEGHEFDVTVRTLADIDSFYFSQPTKSISFDVSKPHKFITLFIPLELLWNPYEVYLGDRKILNHEFYNNGTHIWLNIRPENAGTVTIIGTSVIPEFSMFIPWFVGMSLIFLLRFKKMLNLH